MTWDAFHRHYLMIPGTGLSLDTSRMGIEETYWETMAPRAEEALAAMRDLEAGAIANPDENRQVGHYWLRAPELAPSAEIRKAIEASLEQIETFAGAVHAGVITGGKGRFEHLLMIGIGGSALGPQFVGEALGQPRGDRLQLHFFDNTDPDGIDSVLSRLEDRLGQTLCVVTSKSGGTPETRNGMLEAAHAYQEAGLSFAAHAVAVTGEGSQLDELARKDGWLARFPMWDWVGGRTSETATVGLLPAALQGIDIREFLEGARRMDVATRSKDPWTNPAVRMALAWFHATEGKGKKDMVVLPYKDRLALFAKYLQQLVMESLGKEKDLRGKVVRQGIAVYGNKGSTDQHAYVQQLREGIPNFFAVFIEVLKDRGGASIEVEPGISSGDYLQGFLLGTREALSETGRPSLTLTVNAITPRSTGALIALFERSVGIYASLVGINAYHQPGVEAGKKAAAGILDLKKRIMSAIAKHPGSTWTASALAEAIGEPERTETVFKLMQHLAHNRDGIGIEGGTESPSKICFRCGA